MEARSGGCRDGAVVGGLARVGKELGALVAVLDQVDGGQGAIAREPGRVGHRLGVVDGGLGRVAGVPGVVGARLDRVDERQGADGDLHRFVDDGLGAIVGGLARSGARSCRC